jgi:murein DD-endopeptidase MepM/ murein hydrolase activator NlpD
MVTSVVLLAAAWTAPLLVSSPQPWLPPIDGAVVVNGFHPPPALEPWLPGHRGVDLAAAQGQLVVAAGPGIVLFAGPVAGRSVIVIGHGPLRTTYEPVRTSVAVGDPVSTGTPIGTLDAPVGGSHCRPACLHWGLVRGTTYLDPLSLLEALPVRLLPFDDNTASRSIRPQAARPPTDPASQLAGAASAIRQPHTIEDASDGPPDGRVTSGRGQSQDMPSDPVPLGDLFATGATTLSAGVVIPLAGVIRRRRLARPGRQPGGG